MPISAQAQSTDPDPNANKLQTSSDAASYDSMGRLSQGSNPTEINAYWIPSGDDTAGYVWSQQTYDWKGRPKVTTNPDNSTKSYDYGGCGCTILDCTMICWKSALVSGTSSYLIDSERRNNSISASKAFDDVLQAHCKPPQLP
ncbi:MAG: hypothetical protein JNM09_21880 [Blastocatellia bacterium]|nr:hypothetical protein [Blastocatellia bacterium]